MVTPLSPSPESDLFEHADQQLVDVVLQPGRRLDELGAERDGQILALCKKARKEQQEIERGSIGERTIKKIERNQFPVPLVSSMTRRS